MRSQTWEGESMKKSLIVAVLALAACTRTNTTSTSSGSTDAVKPVASARKAVPIPVSCAPAAVEETRKGFALDNEQRGAEAEERFKAALAADPKCWIAMAHLGFRMPGESGTKMVDDAVTASNALPEGERLIIQFLAQNRHGQTDKTLETAKKISEVLPDTWEAHAVLAQQQFMRKQWDAALASYRTAAELAPTQGAIQNEMGYAYLAQDKLDDAIAAFKRYTELSPNEANAYDSYGEVLLAAGRYDESETAFRKSIELLPSFGLAMQGVAIGKMLRNDWTGAQEALAKGVEAVGRPQEKLALRANAATALFLAGKTAEALKAYEAIEKDAVTSKVPWFQVSSPLQRAWIQVQTGKHAEALTTIAAAEKKIGTSGVPEGSQRELKLMANGIRLRAQTSLGKKADAVKTAAAIQELTAFDANDPYLRSLGNWAAGHVAFGAADYKTAIAKYSACERDDVECKVDLVTAYEKAGDKAGAEKVKAEILSRKMRSVIYVWAHHRIAPATGTGG